MPLSLLRKTAFAALGSGLVFLGLAEGTWLVQARTPLRDPRADAAAIHYAPAENLEKIDVAALDRATLRIDIAAYVLTDYAIVDALARAADRGVAIRILLDRGQAAQRPEVPPLTALRAKPGVAARLKRGRPLMHLKAYAIDGRLLRTGSANFSASGLKQQDNDLVLVDGAAAADAFTARFEAIWQDAEAR